MAHLVRNQTEGRDGYQPCGHLHGLSGDEIRYQGSAATMLGTLMVHRTRDGGWRTMRVKEIEMSAIVVLESASQALGRYPKADGMAFFMAG